jgi:hypothetical protein
VQALISWKGVLRTRRRSGVWRAVCAKNVYVWFAAYTYPRIKLNVRFRVCSLYITV